MTSKFSVGVIIPTYNRFEETLKAVDSVLNQTLAVSQVVVVDDGSEKEILEKLKSELQYRFVELLEIKHSAHPGIVREAGRSILQTEWIAFLDSDDYWNPNKMERIFFHQEIYGAEAICSLASGMVYPNDRRKSARYLTRREVFKENKIINSSVVIRSDLLDQIGGVATSYSVRGCEDYATWLRVTDKSRWLFVNEPLIFYNQTSIDSIRGNEEFQQDFSNISAMLDYVLYSKSNGYRKFLSLRVILRFFWRFVV